MASTHRWVSIEEPMPDQPTGLCRFTVPDGFARRPPTRTEAAIGRFDRERFLALRFVSAAETRAWSHVDDWWSWTSVTTASTASPIKVVPHIRSSDVQSAKNWGEWFRNALVGSVNTPLYPGNWQLAERLAGRDRQPGIPISMTGRRWHIPPLTTETINLPWARAYDVDTPWDDILPMRPASDASSGRVKWWRKVARDKNLPPVLLMYCTPALGWLVLDGHDRLLAASLEDVEPRFLTLVPLRLIDHSHRAAERHEIHEALVAQLNAAPDEQRVRDGVNRALIGLWDDVYVEVMTRTWPIPGGLTTWRREVAEQPLNELTEFMRGV